MLNPQRGNSLYWFRSEFCVADLVLRHLQASTDSTTLLITLASISYMAEMDDIDHLNIDDTGSHWRRQGEKATACFIGRGGHGEVWKVCPTF